MQGGGREGYDPPLLSNDNVTRVTYKISTLCLPQIQIQARGEKLHDPVSTLFLSMKGSFYSTRKANIDNHGKYGKQRETSTMWKFNGSFAT